MAFVDNLHQLRWQHPILWAATIIFLSALSLHTFTLLLGQTTRVKAPRVGKSPWLLGLARAKADFVKNGAALTKYGYEKYRDGMYWIQTGDTERLVLPHRYLDELRKLPENVIDSRRAIVERNLGEYVGVDIILRSQLHVNICRTQLVQHLAKITRGQIQELPQIFEAELGSDVHSGELRYFVASTTMLEIANKAVAKALVGEPLCHDQTWLTNSLQTTVNVGLHVKSLQAYPAFLRPIVNKLLKSRRRLDKSSVEAERILRPIVARRSPGDENYDILQWLLDGTDPEELSMPFLTKQMLFLAIAAVRSTANSIVNTLFDIIEHTECQEVLRREVEESLRINGGWSLAAIQNMNKLDSFIKESQRLNHPLLLNFNRKILRSVTLSDGLTIPAGTFICTPAYWIARDNAYFPGGEEFRPWRWDELRKQAESQGHSATPYLSSSTSAENLHWGVGRGQCPGRFMAAAEMKLIIAWILWNYDVQFPDGQLTKPESISVDERVLPNPTQKIGFKRRVKSAT